jgi:hypothetical protein
LSDHAFTLTTSPADSLAEWGKPGASFNPNVLPIIRGWLQQQLKQPLILLKASLSKYDTCISIMPLLVYGKAETAL